MAVALFAAPQRGVESATVGLTLNDVLDVKALKGGEVVLKPSALCEVPSTQPRVLADLIRAVKGREVILNLEHVRSVVDGPLTSGLVSLLHYPAGTVTLMHVSPRVERQLSQLRIYHRMNHTDGLRLVAESIDDAGTAALRASLDEVLRKESDPLRGRFDSWQFSRPRALGRYAVQEERSDGCSVILASGYIGSDRAVTDLRNCVSESLQRNVPFILDLTAVTCLKAPAVAAIFGALREYDRHGRRGLESPKGRSLLVLVAPDEGQPYDILKRSGLGAAVKVYHSRQEAFDALGG